MINVPPSSFSRHRCEKEEEIRNPYGAASNDSRKKPSLCIKHVQLGILSSKRGGNVNLRNTSLEFQEFRFVCGINNV